MDNILFLDIDGVLNSMRSSVAYGTYNKLDEISVKLLNEICLDCGCGIVISSTWRKNHKPHKLVGILQGHGVDKFPMNEMLKLDCFYTPVINTHGSIRGNEIEQWLKEYGGCNYVILDDDSDMTDEQKQNHFVHVNGEVGITVQNMLDVKKLFKKQVLGEV